MNNNQNSYSNNDCDNSILFFKLFKNNVIKNNIFKYLKLYNNHNKYIWIDQSVDIKSYPYIEYLQAVKLDVNDDVVDKFNTINYIIKITNGDCKFDLLFGGSEFQEKNNDEDDDDEESGDYPDTEDDRDAVNNEGEHDKEEDKDKDKANTECNNQEKPILKVPFNIINLVNEVYGSYYNVVEEEQLFKLPIKLESYYVDFQYKLNQDTIPEGVETLFNYGNWNEPLSYLPSSLKLLHLPCGFKRIIGDSENQIKSNQLKELIIGGPIDYQLKEGVLPSSIEILNIYSSIMCPISSEWLPSGLKKLSIYSDCVQEFNESSLLPLKNLNELILGTDFNNDLVLNDSKCLLPDSITKLVFNNKVNSTLYQHSLPGNLKILKFKYKEQQDEINDDSDNIQLIKPGLLPNQIQSLRLQNNHRITSTQSIPSSVTKIKNIHSIDQLKLLPTNVVDVTLSYSFNSEINQGDIPQHIQKLTFGKQFYQHFKKDSLVNNNSLKSIRFKGPAPIFNNDSLPNTLEHLEYHYSHGNIPILPGQLPKQLKSFILPNQMYSKNLMCAPESIPNLLATRLSCTYPPFKPSKFPDSLEILRIYSSDPIKLNELPKSTKHLFIDGNCKLITPVPSSLKAIYTSTSDFIFNNTHQDIINILIVFSNDKQLNNHFNNLLNNL